MGPACRGEIPRGKTGCGCSGPVALAQTMAARLQPEPGIGAGSGGAFASSVPATLVAADSLHAAANGAGTFCATRQCPRSISRPPGTQPGWKDHPLGG